MSRGRYDGYGTIQALNTWYCWTWHAVSYWNLKIKKASSVVSSSREMVGSSDMKLENLKTWNETKSENNFVFELNRNGVLVNMDWLAHIWMKFLSCIELFSSHLGVSLTFTKLNLIQSDLIWSKHSFRSIHPASIA